MKLIIWSVVIATVYFGFVFGLKKYHEYASRTKDEDATQDDSIIKFYQKGKEDKEPMAKYANLSDNPSNIEGKGATIQDDFDDDEDI